MNWSSKGENEKHNRANSAQREEVEMLNCEEEKIGDLKRDEFCVQIISETKLDIFFSSPKALSISSTSPLPAALIQHNIMVK